MTRVASFSDGFTSATPPDIEGSVQDNYTIADNQAVALELFTVDALEYKAAFYDFELSRIDVSNEYRQVGTFILSYDGSSWIYNLGNWQGDDMIVSTLSNAFDVKFEVSTSAGVCSFKYTSGDMGASYVGSLKLVSTKVIA